MSYPAIIGPNGISLPSQSDLLNTLLNGTSDGTPGLFAIYGADINVDSNSPDGQRLNIIAQIIADLYDYAGQIYTSMDPDQAIGTQLDSRCAINGVIRQGGTYTEQNIVVVVSQAVTLPGLDTAPLAPFTVADANGNQYQLLTTYNFSGAGTATLAFQAALVGNITSSLNTITNTVTELLGVTSVNNPAAPTVAGLNQETDAALRIRRAASVELPSKGYLQGLIGAITDITGVAQVNIYENDTNTTDANGIPPHSIWIVVDAPSSLNTQIGQAIYVKRNAGPGWKNGGTGATATPTISGTGIASVAVNTAGVGYDNAPAVAITGDGTGATAHSTLSGTGVATVVVDTAGTGYTHAAVVFNPETNRVPIAEIDGNTFNIYFDNPNPVQLYFKATCVAITGTIDETYIKAQILSQFQKYKINQSADASAIVAFIKSIAPNASVSAEGVSLTNGSGYTSLLTQATINDQFVMAGLGNITLS